jgi:ATP-dependent Lon protease
VSLAQGKPVSSDVAMTGEITLTGQVLQIGGVRDKVLAAQRAGVHTVILPRENEPDLVELPAEAREQLGFVLADTIEDVLPVALDGAEPKARQRPRGAASPERKAARSA